ncbi:MAG: signal peptidase I [Xanthomonadales bacterium]
MNSTALYLRRIVRDWLPAVLIIGILLAARSTLADHYHVPSGSMETALLPGDHVVVNKLAYGLRVPFTKHVLGFAEAPLRGDVVILDSPDDGVRLIKRVAALGGDTVDLRGGHLFINGRPMAVAGRVNVERFGERDVILNLDAGGGPDIRGLVVPDGEVLLLGDHRGASRDSRWFGTVPVGELYGRAGGVFWRRGEGPTWQAL